MEKNKKEKSTKPMYNMWQCSGYMIRTTWREKEKKVLVLCLLQALFAVASNLINLYISPSILSVVEKNAAISELILTILVFALLLMFCASISSYIDSNTLFGRISVRSAIIAKINVKSCITSYPNTGDEKFIKLRSKSHDATNANQSATEAIWTTLTSLIQNIIINFGILCFFSRILILQRIFEFSA